MNGKDCCYFLFPTTGYYHHIWLRFSERIIYSNHEIRSYDQTRKNILSLGSKKGQNENNASCQLICLYNSLITSIVNSPEKDSSNVDGKFDMKKVCTYSVKSSSKLFPCSICAIYNRVNCAQKQRLALKSYIPGINSLVYTKRHYDNYFTVKPVNELHEWIEKHPHVIQSPNISDSLFSKINGTLVNKQNHLLQVSVRYLHNDMILPI